MNSLQYTQTHVLKLDEAFPLEKLAELDPYHQNKAKKITNSNWQRNYIEVHLWLNAHLATLTGEQPQELRFGFAENGKPHLIDYPEIHFNLSHCKGMALLAVADRPVGVDVEPVDRVADWQGIAERFFHQQEYQAILALPEAEQALGFLRIWTAKEALLKATGQGIAHGLDGFVVSPKESDATLLLEAVDKNLLKYNVLRVSVGAGFVAAIAFARSE